MRSVKKNSFSDPSLSIYVPEQNPGGQPNDLLYNRNDCNSKLKELVVAQHPPEQEDEKDGNSAAQYWLHLGLADTHGLTPDYCQPAPPATRAEPGVQDTADHPKHGYQHPVLVGSWIPIWVMSNDSKVLCGWINGVHDFFSPLHNHSKGEQSEWTFVKSASKTKKDQIIFLRVFLTLTVILVIYEKDL